MSFNCDFTLSWQSTADELAQGNGRGNPIVTIDGQELSLLTGDCMHELVHHCTNTIGESTRCSLLSDLWACEEASQEALEAWRRTITD